MKFNQNYCFEYNDSFNLFNRIKKINPNYKLFINKKDNCFIVINSAKNNQICLNFNNFNQNIEKILQFTKVENSKNLFCLVDKNNEKLEQSKKQVFKYETKSKLFEIKNFINKTPFI